MIGEDTRYSNGRFLSIRYFLVLVSVFHLTACDGHTYHVTQRVSPYVQENLESLSKLADLISEEAEIGEVWCMPTMEARDKNGGDWFELQGDKRDAYRHQCVAAQSEGVYMEDGGPVIVLQLIVFESTALHFELLRPLKEEHRTQTCGLLSFLAFVERCQMPLEVDGWVVRYTALTDDERARLIQAMQ